MLFTCKETTVRGTKLIRGRDPYLFCGVQAGINEYLRVVHWKNRRRDISHWPQAHWSSEVDARNPEVQKVVSYPSEIEWCLGPAYRQDLLLKKELI